MHCPSQWVPTSATLPYLDPGQYRTGNRKQGAKKGNSLFPYAGHNVQAVGSGGVRQVIVDMGGTELHTLAMKRKRTHCTRHTGPG